MQKLEKKLTIHQKKSESMLWLNRKRQCDEVRMQM